MTKKKKKKVAITRENGYVRIVLPDSIGMDESVEIEKEIIAQLSDKKEKIIIDFTMTNTLYSSGMGLLIRLQKITKEKNEQINIINVSKKLRNYFESLKLDRVFKIYATDVEFDLSKDEIWKKKVSEAKDGFIFVAQVEEEMYRLTFSGQMSSLQDLSLLSEFAPKEDIEYFIFNFESLDVIDTYGAQVFNDLVDRIQNMGKKCVVYGASQVILDVFELFPSKSKLDFYTSEKEAVKKIKK